MIPTKWERAVARYVAHMRTLGCRFSGQAGVLQRCSHFCRAEGNTEIDAALFRRWLLTLREHNPNTRRRYHQLVRNCCLHRRRHDPDCFVPTDDFAKSQPPIEPVIVEPDEVARMLEIASGLPEHPNSGLYGPVLRLAIVLLYTAGLRLGETLRLLIGDVSDDGRLLFIRESKFCKSRWIPLSPSAASELRTFIAARAKSFPASPSAPLLCNGPWKRPHGYSKPGMYCALRRLFKLADVRDSRGRYPRVHDLRHSFAIQAMVRWYRAGADLQSSLPKLALFMGHVSIESSAYYLRWTPAIRQLASKRFEQNFGAVIGGGGQ